MLLLLFNPELSLRVNAWILAKITKSSSPLVSSRQLFRLDKTVSSWNSLEQGPPLDPYEQAQPSRRNFLVFSIDWFGFSSVSR